MTTRSLMPLARSMSSASIRRLGGQPPSSMRSGRTARSVRGPVASIGPRSRIGRLIAPSGSTASVRPCPSRPTGSAQSRCGARCCNDGGRRKSGERQRHGTEARSWSRRIRRRRLLRGTSRVAATRTVKIQLRRPSSGIASSRSSRAPFPAGSTFSRHERLASSRITSSMRCSPRSWRSLPRRRQLTPAHRVPARRGAAGGLDSRAVELPLVARTQLTPAATQPRCQ